nr:zinc finger, GRF-type [Ipomoea batatas]
MRTRVEGIGNVQVDGSCGFVKWYDPPMCPRSERIIPGLLKRINKNEEVIVKNEEEIAKLKAMVKSLRTREEMKDKNMGRNCTSKMVVVVLIVVLMCCLAIGKNESYGVHMLP